MYRRLIVSVYQTRGCALHVYNRESCLRSSKCDRTLPICRAANGRVSNAFGTSSVAYCERKDEPLVLKDKSVVQGGVQKEAVQVVGEKLVELQDHVKMIAEPSEQSVSSERVPVQESENVEIIVKTKRFDHNLDTKMERVAENNTIQAISTTTECQPILEVKMAEIKKGLKMEAITTASRTGGVDQNPEDTMEVVNKCETITRIQVKTEEAAELNMVGDKFVQQKAENQRTDIFPKEQIQSVKSGKESLLTLLGEMKVDVTNKRKLKALKMQRISELAARPKTDTMESTISMFQEAPGMANATAPTPRQTLSPELVAAASAAASTLPNKSKAESELLKKLRQHEAVGEAQKNGDNIGVIISDMKVGKRPNGRQNARPTNQIRFDDDGHGYTNDRGITAELDGGLRRRRSLFSGKKLSIFTPGTEAEADKDIACPTLWDIDLANKVGLSATQLPRNGFEEMIQWTKVGKLWQYPVNNEAGLEEEAQVPFYEHVFLEKHLEEGFPRQGPIRHFMELVVSGLAKNPYYTVQQKRDHIAWFRDYFRQKEEVLKEAEVYLN
ncbi:28S ribosomal protein S31, mitochondrial [Esox lucius]|uniref:Small ribosomal subunit protein mS31 n=1 Tax=Esox lucius TaxID=8010 RepID=A0A3P8YFN1_ESOLU|nr:28S ribosomal protein S31, mitochondrial [Esox lucius]